MVSVGLNATEDKDEHDEEDADTDEEDNAESELGCKVATRFCSIKLVLRDSTPRAGSRGVTNLHTKHSIYTKNRRQRSYIFIRKFVGEDNYKMCDIGS